MEKCFKNSHQVWILANWTDWKHIFLTDGTHKVTVPHHKEIKKGTLLSIISQSGLTKEKFL